MKQIKSAAMLAAGVATGVATGVLTMASVFFGS